MAKKTASPLMICAPNPGDHYDPILDLSGKVFGGSRGYFGWQQYCHDGYIDGSSYDWDASRIALAGSQLAGHIGVWKYATRVGQARLITGGIGIVMTHGEYRKAGLASKTMAATIESMRELGYDLSVLFGIRNFYGRFGFTQAWPDCTVELPGDKVWPGRPTLRRRRGDMVQLLRAQGEVGRIYNRDYADRVGAADRPVYTLDLHRWRLDELIDRQKKVRGYLATQVDGTTLRIWEVGGFTTPAGCAELLGHIQQLARESKCAAVVLQLGLGHPLLEPLRRTGCKISLEYIGDGGAMVLVVNLASALTKLSGELTRRLAASPLARYSGALAIQLNEQRATLAIQRGQVSLAQRAIKATARLSGGPDVARLLIGADAPTVVIQAGGIKCAGNAALLAEALFPARSPFLPRADWF